MDVHHRLATRLRANPGADGGEVSQQIPAALPAAGITASVLTAAEQTRRT